MKKIKLLAPILSVITFSSAIAPLVGCSSNKDAQGTLELSDSVKALNITIAETSICKNKDSWFTLNLPAGKEIKSIAINIGNSEIYLSEVKLENNKITIPADKMIDSNVIVKTVGFELPTVTGIKVNPDTLTKAVNAQITADELNVTLMFNDETEKRNAEYGADYKVYLEDETEKTLPYTVEDKYAGNVLTLIIKSVADSTKTAQLKINVNPIFVDSIEIKNTETKIRVGDMLELKASILPENATNKNLKWVITQGSNCAYIETTTGVPVLIGSEPGKVRIVAVAQDGNPELVVSNEKEFEIEPGIKAATLKYDSSWASAGITLSGETKSITSESETTSKISIHCTTAADVEGFAQVYDGTSLLQETEFKTISSSTRATIEITFNEWDSIKSGKELTIKLSRSHFNKKSWTSIAKACRSFEVNANPTVKSAQILCEALGYNASSTTKTTAKEVLEEQLVGKEGVILINNRLHTVRIIDAMHADDKLVDSDGKVTKTPAALTFETVTLLSNANGDRMFTKYDSSLEYIDDYINTTLRYNLTGNGSPRSSIGKWGNSVFSMLPQELKTAGAIKNVAKTVATIQGKGWRNSTYHDKLFPITMSEMNLKHSFVKPEGSAYKYWQVHAAQSDRIKKDLKGQVGEYWTSHNCEYADATSSYTINVSGGWNIWEGSNEYNINFGFCI